MVGDDLRIARKRLGELWALDRPVFASELGRVLGNTAADPGEMIRDYEHARTKPVPWYLAAAVEMMLRGSLPPAGLPR